MLHIESAGKAANIMVVLAARRERCGVCADAIGRGEPVWGFQWTRDMIPQACCTGCAISSGIVRVQLS